jgi:transcriptional regulator with XRE-family HTH domain
MQESIGQRIARFRSQNGWTQEQLARRIAISRVAISHLEMGLSIPSERTIALLSSVFRIAPHEFVSATTYPQAKADRLPLTVAWYTQRDHQLSMLNRDLLWLQRIAVSFERQRLIAQVVEEWLPQINVWLSECYDKDEKQELINVRRLLMSETSIREPSAKSRC